MAKKEFKKGDTIELVENGNVVKAKVLDTFLLQKTLKKELKL